LRDLDALPLGESWAGELLTFLLRGASAASRALRTSNQRG